MDLHPLFPAPRRAPEIVSLLGWLGAFCEASPGRATHPRPAVRPRNGDGERKANPHPKSHPERTLPPSRKWEALGPCPDPLVHPIPPSSPATSQQSQPSRAQPLRHEPVPRICFSPMLGTRDHRRQEKQASFRQEEAANRPVFGSLYLQGMG